MFWWSDLRSLRRSLLRSPGKVVVLWLCTSLWIVVAPAFLSLLGVLSWRSLPFPDPARLVWINAGLDLAPILTTNVNFDAVASFETGWVLLEGPGGKATILGAAVDAPFFDALGAQPISGRTFAVSGAPAEVDTAVVSEDLYRRLFPAQDLTDRPAILRVEGRPFTILGVIPNHPVFPTGADVWFLRSSGITVRPDFLPADAIQLGIVGRLSNGATLDSAYTAVDAAAQEVLRRTSISSGDIAVVPFETILRWRGQGERAVLQVCLAALACLLLLATAGTLSGVLLDRQPEFAVRLALGARRLDLVRLILLQMLILAGPGLLAGLPVSVHVLERLAGLVPEDLAALLPPALSGRSLGLALTGWALVSGLGTAFAWLVASPGGPGLLLAPDRRRTAPQGPRVYLRLTALCIALGLAMTLGALAAMLRDSVTRLERQPLGFEPKGVATAVLRWRQAPSAAASSFLGEQSRRFRRIPGVISIAFSDSIPFSSSIPQLEVTTPDRERSSLAYVQRIHGDYLGAMGIRLLAGRDITPLEYSIGAAVVLLDEVGARTMFGAVTVPGHTLRVGDELMEVVGVIASPKVASLDEVVRPKIYRPLLGSADRSPAALAVLARLSGPVNAESFAQAASSPGVFLSQYRPMTAGIDATTANRRLARDLATLQWLATLAFVALATFGTFSWWLDARSFELTVRLALGDTRPGIAKRIFRSAGWLGAGAALLAFASYVPAAHALRALLYGVGTLSPGAFLEAIATAGAAGFAATALALWSAFRRLSFDRLKS